MIGIKGVIYNDNELHMIHEQLELVRENLLLAYYDKDFSPLDSEAYEVQRHFNTIHRIFNHLNVLDQYLYKEKS